MSRATRAQAARRTGQDRPAALRLRQLGIAAALADSEQQIATERSAQPAADPHDVIVHTIVEMARAFPGMDHPTAARLLSEADQAHREGPTAADTLGAFLAEVRDPTTGALEAGARYRVTKIAHRVYKVTVLAVDE